MKKSNWVVYIVAIVVSAFLLWLWFWLGFDHVDAPLDLVLSIIWWVLVAVACFAVHRIEKKRQERVRTCYVASNHVYNSEIGTESARTPEQVVERIHDMLRDLEYGMEIRDMPKDAEGKTVRYDYIVRSKVFDLKKQENQSRDQQEELDWRGEVAVTARPDDEPLTFDGRDGLASIMARLFEDSSSRQM